MIATFHVSFRKDDIVSYKSDDASFTDGCDIFPDYVETIEGKVMMGFE